MSISLTTKPRIDRETSTGGKRGGPSRHSLKLALPRVKVGQAFHGQSHTLPRDLGDRLSTDLPIPLVLVRRTLLLVGKDEIPADDLGTVRVPPGGRYPTLTHPRRTELDHPLQSPGEVLFSQGFPFLVHPDPVRPGRVLPRHLARLTREQCQGPHLLGDRYPSRSILLGQSDGIRLRLVDQVQPYLERPEGFSRLTGGFVHRREGYIETGQFQERIHAEFSTGKRSSLVDRTERWRGRSRIVRARRCMSTQSAMRRVKGGLTHLWKSFSLPPISPLFLALIALFKSSRTSGGQVLKAKYHSNLIIPVSVRSDLGTDVEISPDSQAVGRHEHSHQGQRPEQVRYPKPSRLILGVDPA